MKLKVDNVLINEKKVSAEGTENYITVERIVNKSWKLTEIHGFTAVSDVVKCLEEALTDKEIICVILGKSQTVVKRESNVAKVLKERNLDAIERLIFQ